MIRSIDKSVGNAIFIVLGVIFTLGSLMVGLFSLLLRSEDYVTMNTVGYINSGSDCSVLCSPPVQMCGATGYINISFYPPNQTELIYQKMLVPPLCYGYFDEEAFCCQNYIKSQELLWFYVHVEDGQYIAKYVDTNEITDVKFFLIIGSISLILSCFCCCFTTYLGHSKKS